MVATCFVASCGVSNFVCNDDAACSGQGGLCLDGHCAFPDDRCPSGWKYAEHSGAASGQCAPTNEPTQTGSGETGEGETSDESEGSSDATSSAPAGVTTDGPSDATFSTGPMAGPVQFIDDELAGEFEEGTFDRMVYTDDRLRLAEGSNSGTFVSRVFDAEGTVQWHTLSWQPDGPYAKPLPDQGQAESGYVGGIDMDANMLLMHFDEPGVLDPMSVIADRSGHGNDGSIASTGPASAATTGLFGAALDDDVDAYVSIPPGLPDFDFGEDPFTWAIWFRYEHDCATNNVFMGIDDVVGGGDSEPHLWMGCTSSAWETCPGNAEEPRPAGVLRSQHSLAGDGVTFCGPGGTNDGRWHHMAIVKDGHAPATVDLYVDGELVQSNDGTFTAPIDMDAEEGDFALGGFSGATYPSSGVFDDAAIWTRALGADEVRGLYRRGALVVRVEVRICEMPGCADEPAFVGGSDLSPGGFFTDPAGALVPGTELSLEALPAGRYTQYRLTFSTDAVDLVSPALAAVRLLGETIE